MTILYLVLIVWAVTPVLGLLFGAVANGRGASASDWPPRGWRR